jgi:hypothetical protein
MRTLNLNELNEVEGGRMSAALAVSIVNFFSDLYTLADAAMQIDYGKVVSSSTTDFGGVNAMGDYTNGMCSR